MEEKGMVMVSGPKKMFPNRPQHLIELACKVLNAPLGGIGFLSAGGSLVDEYTYGLADEDVGKPAWQHWVREALTLTLQKTSPTLLAEPARQLPHLNFNGDPFPLGSLLLIPLAKPGRFRGAMFLARGKDSPPFSPTDQELVLPIRSCLEIGNLYEEVYLLAQLRLLKQVARVTAGNLELSAILDKTLRELDRNLPMTVCAVWLVENGIAATAPPAPIYLNLSCLGSAYREQAASFGLTPGLRVPLEQTPFGPCWKKNEGIYGEWHGLGQTPRVHNAPVSAESPGPTFSFATPLQVGDQPVGILQAINRRPSGFTNEQIQLLYLVADLLGPAISNCRLVERLRATCEELRSAQEQLIRNEKIRALGELAGGMAHNFNNSLCGVLGFLEMSLLDKGLGSSTRSHLELARTCAMDAAQTVRRVQDFSRQPSGDPRFQLLDPNRLVRESVELTRPKWEGRQGMQTPIHLELQTQASSPLLGNEAELREVLTNLLFNAVDAMPQGGTLGLRCWSDSAHVFLEVRDTGVGMDENVRRRLFEPFFTTKGEHGTGLGLSVAFGTVRNHGGDIQVATELGKGSLFTLRLPVAPSRPSPLKSGLAATANPAPTIPVRFRGLRILVVEDEAAIRQFLSQALTGMGHHPAVARNAEEALQTFSPSSFDVVLTDLGLPDMTGDLLAQAITLNSPNTPIVLLTGWGDQLAAEGGNMPGIRRILGKPILLNRLQEALAAVCPS